MAVLQPVSRSVGRAPSSIRRTVALAAVALLWGLWPGSGRALSAGIPLFSQPNRNRATTSRSARENAIQGIPTERLDAGARAKVASVISDISVFRRMPVSVVDCDPDLYLFLVRHPDVVVNIWDVLGISQMEVRQTGPDTYQMADAAGTKATIEYLYRSHDMHVVYAEGSYDGPLTARPIRSKCLMVLGTGYVLETDGRYYISNRLDTFLQVEAGAAELLTKTFQALVGMIADNNFLQTVGFLSSLSRTAELDAGSVQRLASKLANIQPEHRQRLAELAAHVGRKHAVSTASDTAAVPQVAAREAAVQHR